MPIGLDTVVSRNDDLVAVEVDRTVVMMSIEQGMYFGLDGAGPRIWSLLGTPHTVDELCRELGQEFDVELDVCRDDVSAFLGELVEAGLVRIHDQTAANPRPPAGP
jgi:hypothetical protein